MKIALVATKEDGLQINADKNKIMFMSFEQTGSGEGQIMAGSCEHGTESSGCLRFEKVSDLHTYSMEQSSS